MEMYVYLQLQLLYFGIDLLQFSSGGVATFLFWRSAYMSNLFSLRNRSLVLIDWAKVSIFGRLVILSLDDQSLLTQSLGTSAETRNTTRSGVDGSGRNPLAIVSFIELL